MSTPARSRLRRMLGVFAAGRILNPKTARSQMIGGMIWGVGAALMEETVLDPRHGHFVNHDLAEYHVPVNADVPEVEAIFLDEHDDKGNPLGAKGIGELGNCGAGAAVANAVYNATGIRVREFPDHARQGLSRSDVRLNSLRQHACESRLASATRASASRHWR